MAQRAVLVVILHATDGTVPEESCKPDRVLNIALFRCAMDGFTKIKHAKRLIFEACRRRVPRRSGFKKWGRKALSRHLAKPKTGAKIPLQPTRRRLLDCRRAPRQGASCGISRSKQHARMVV